jgi:hypothetical protein
MILNTDFSLESFHILSHSILTLLSKVTTFNSILLNTYFTPESYQTRWPWRLTSGLQCWKLLKFDSFDHSFSSWKLPKLDSLHHLPSSRKLSKFDSILTIDFRLESYHFRSHSTLTFLFKVITFHCIQHSFSFRKLSPSIALNAHFRLQSCRAPSIQHSLSFWKLRRSIPLKIDFSLEDWL